MSKWRDAVAALVSERDELMRNLSGADPDKIGGNSRGNAGPSASRRIDPVYPVVPGVDRVTDLTIYLSTPPRRAESGNSQQEAAAPHVVALAAGETGKT